ncbi:L-threonylcarbamoyladenylate synthase [Enteractinococcus coprophilus]|uniref:L-threonylcarbamoyladenylate synthase n=1 Tax=Enteractinococcus coprophilus TaxID=1027633 RepID=A0A542ZZR4_9MICC|nr:L-threonylcarbamoyladenylate synthase [Enteractinococcus coprophilus]TQL65845.1 tRNA threonylcarbamoyl adenosine modification protein (Sua5/YciO/YrdC/YwlC family) [Enteractinococcus coprophilus]
MTQLFDAQESDQRTAAIAAASKAISQRELIVLPTDTVYGVGADAFNPQAVAVLLAAKGRSRQSPPPVLIGNMQVLDALAVDIPATGRQLAQAFWPGALTLIFNAQPSLSWDLGETHGTVALRQPADALAQQILQNTGPLAVSSANRHGQPAATTAQAAQEALGASVSVYIHDGDRGAQQASTIVDCTVTPHRVLRQGAISIEELRQVVPDVLDLNDPEPPTSGSTGATTWEDSSSS